MQAGTKRFRIGGRTVHLLIDVALFVAFLFAMAPHLTTTALHEWLTIGMAVLVVVHLLVNWSWIVAVTQRFLGQVNWSARVNYILNTVIFVDFALIMFSGLMISQAVLPLFGVQTEPGGTWRFVHSLSADVFPFLVGLHVALHWTWIVNTTKRLLGRHHPQPVSHAVVATVPVPTTSGRTTGGMR